MSNYVLDAEACLVNGKDQGNRIPVLSGGRELREM